MLLGFAKASGLKRRILIVPVMTPKLSSYWLYFVTSTSYKLATSLVDSMKVEVVCENNDINKLLNVHPMNYQGALERALDKKKGNDIESSSKDSSGSEKLDHKLLLFLDVLTNGYFMDQRTGRIKNIVVTKDKIWRIGGEREWYDSNWLWKTRGLVDKVFGGVGLLSGRSHRSNFITWGWCYLYERAICKKSRRPVINFC